MGWSVLEQELEESLAEKALERTRTSGDTVHRAGHKLQLEKLQHQMMLKKPGSPHSPSASQPRLWPGGFWGTQVVLVPTFDFDF